MGASDVISLGREMGDVGVDQYQMCPSSWDWIVRFGDAVVIRNYSLTWYLVCLQQTSYNYN